MVDSLVSNTVLLMYLSPTYILMDSLESAHGRKRQCHVDNWSRVGTQASSFRLVSIIVSNDTQAYHQ